MSWDPEFLELMGFTSDLYPPASRDVYGKPSWGSPQRVRCRILEDEHEITDVEGQTRVSAGTIWCPPPGGLDAAGVLVGPTDLPTMNWEMTMLDGTRMSIQKVEQVTDEDSVHHLKIHFGAA